MKKVLKIVGVTLIIIVLLLVASPYIFKNKIKEMVKVFINETVNAKVDFSDVSLSFIRSFPEANLTIDNLTVTNYAPFENQQVINSKSIALDFAITELFKNTTDGPIKVNTFYINEALISLKKNKQGVTNWDIAKPKNNTSAISSPEPERKPFVFQLDNYGIINSVFSYEDQKEKLRVYVNNFNHIGNGIFSETISELDTQTNLNITLKIGGTEYLTNNSIALDAVLGLDLEQNKYTFKDNKLVFNQLPIQFNGFVQLLENGQKIDLIFKNTGSTFKDFLAVIPKTYSKDLANVNTTGNFTIKGIVKGDFTETTIPELDINIISNNASFKYTSLPKGVKDIVINTSIKNTTGKFNDTYVDVKKLNFKIDQDVFKSSAKVTHLTGNTTVSAHIDGVLNLENLSKAYPVELENNLTGLLKANLKTSFDINAIQTNAYQRIKNNGRVSIEGFRFSSKDIINPLHISKANVVFNPDVIKLEQFNATTGKTDFNASGTLNNLLGFLLSDKKLKGNFKVKSKVFAVSDFMVEGGEAKLETAKELNKSLKIPAFLDATINANVKMVYYNNLTLKDVKGELIIKDEKAQLNNVASSIFNGELALDGLVDTKAITPTFNMNLSAKNFDISQSFKDLDLLKQLAPLAKLLQGKLNSTIALNGKLGADFTPDLSTVSGQALAELLTTEFTPKNEKLVRLLENKLSFLNLSKLDLKNVVASLIFNNGNVSLKPINFAYNDINIQLGGSHNLQNQMNYQLVLQVPAKYLGSDINKLITKINDPEINKISIPVTANITGSLLEPNVKTDLKSGVKSLTTQLIEIQKQKLIGQGKDQIKNLLGGVLSGSSLEGNSSSSGTSTNSTSNPVKNVLGGLLGGNNSTPKDTTKPKNNPVKDVLGGLFGKKKKKDPGN